MIEQNGEPAFTVVYDSEEGQVVTHDFGIKRAIEVRHRLTEEALRYAAIAELERLGYTITKPGAPLTNYEYAMLDLIRGLVGKHNLLTVAEVNDLDIDDLLDLAREIVGGQS